MFAISFRIMSSILKELTVKRFSLYLELTFSVCPAYNNLIKITLRIVHICFEFVIWTTPIKAAQELGGFKA